MSTLSVLPVFVILTLSLFSLWAIDRLLPLQLTHNQRISSIDGLRGYLAFGVFMHHSCIWYFYLRTGEWTVPPSDFYTQLGQVSVALFFMVTGFLFTAKLVSTPANKMDWLRLYTSRVLRITPLWLTVKIAVVVLAAVMRYWHWDQGNPPLFPSTTSTGLMTASVTWTLYYEWTFYLVLPVIAWALARRTSLSWIAFSLIAVTALGWDRVVSFYAVLFLLGMATAWIVRSQRLQQFARSRWGSLGTAALLISVTTGFPTAYDWQPALILGAAFVLIAAGANLFGLLEWRLSRVFGEITFSIYLLHGLALYVTYRLLLGLETASSLSMNEHWLVTACLAPVVIALSYASYRCIEMPALRQTNAWTAWLRAQLQRNPLRKSTQR